MADLPRSRVTPDQPPFTCVGIDYFGPFLVRQKRSLVKRYGAIFTCLALRAVHLEISHTLDTDSFILALRRFIARRGQVKEIRSDNGTNFTGAEKELRVMISSWNQAKIHDTLLQKGIKWVFNPPAASHQGGVWERLIRSTRKILGALTKEQVLDDECLQTLLCEAESIINGRPLTKVSDNPNDLEPLTPNHLLLLRQKGIYTTRAVGKERHVFQEKMASSPVFGKCVLGSLETRISSFVAGAPEMVSTEKKLHCWRHGYR